MKTTSDHCLLYVTASSQEEALHLGRTLVEERLVACANLIPQMTSLYRWKDKIETAQEVVLLLKTKKCLTDQVRSTIERIHSYEVPCILSLPIEAGLEKYLSWLDESTV